MGRYRFQSELSCDQVWHRLNVLLQSFAVCGAKRCEVRGELTDWGCCLWLRNPEGRNATPVPLRLWTEEGSSPGCVIVGSFLPAGQERQGVLTSVGLLWLEAFLMGLADGVPPFRALMTGLWAGGIAAVVLCLLLFGFPRLFARKRERELLQWVEKYLFLRELDGILLPDPEVQRAEWIGLPNEEQPVGKRRFVFHCGLPPEELPAAMEDWLSRQGMPRTGVRVKWSAKWRGPRLKLFRTEIEEGQREPGSLKIFAGWFKTWQFADPFCGAMEPDGRGGSILRGAFRRQPLSFLPALVVFPVVFFCLRQTGPSSTAPQLLAAVVWAVFLTWRGSMKNPGSRGILEFLRTHFEEV